MDGTPRLVTTVEAN